MGLKLSIIVPIYKVEQYLAKCVDSLLNQDLSPEEYEIVLVDDGSPDRCGEICDEYAANFINIKVFHRANGGLSAARNSGIDVAQGKYVQFVDSDDYLEPNVLKTLVTKIETDNLDILRFNYQNVNEQYKVFDPNKASKYDVDYCDNVCSGLSFLTERLGFGCYAWQFMIKRELLNDCRFKEGIYFEDTEWTPRLLSKANRVTSTDFLVYNYLMRQGSITKSIDEKKKQKVLNDKFLLIDSMKEQMIQASDKRWFEGIIAQTTLSIIGYVCENYYGQRKQFLYQLINRKVFPLSNYHANELARRKIRIANVSPSLLCLLIHMKNR
jgi:glycosyltransferase involved in cell wall biosynthesis